MLVDEINSLSSTCLHRELRENKQLDYHANIMIVTMSAIELTRKNASEGNEPVHAVM